MQRDTLIIQEREYKPTAEQWVLIDDARETFDRAFFEIERQCNHDGETLDCGGDPYHDIGTVYFNRICEIMGIGPAA